MATKVKGSDWQENISMEKGHDGENRKKRVSKKLNAGGEKQISRFILKSVKRVLWRYFYNKTGKNKTQTQI